MAISRDPANIATIRTAFVAAIEAGHSDTSAAGGCGISVRAIQEWKAQGRADIDAGNDTDLARFVQDCARANHARIDLQLAIVKNSATTGDAQSARWLLAAWDREHFGTASKVELTGKDGGAVQVQSFVAVVPPRLSFAEWTAQNSQAKHDGDDPE